MIRWCRFGSGVRIIGAVFWLIFKSFSLGLLEATRLPGFGVVGLVRFAGSKALIFLALRPAYRPVVSRVDHVHPALVPYEAALAFEV